MLPALPWVYVHRYCSTVMQPVGRVTAAGSAASSIGGGGGMAVLTVTVVRGVLVTPYGLVIALATQP